MRRKPVLRQRDAGQKVIFYSEAEESINRWSHGIGAALSLVGTIVLINQTAGKGDLYRLVSVCVYGAAMLIFYTLSTVYHCVKTPRFRHLFRILDHVSIYLMIAGSYTPFTLVTLRGRWGWILFGIVWGLGSIGALLKIFTTHRFPILGPILYLVLGWAVLIVIKPLSLALAPLGLKLLFSGGIAYSVGVLFYLWESLPFNHAIWHIFVLSGSTCHFLAILFCIAQFHF